MRKALIVGQKLTSVSGNTWTVQAIMGNVFLASLQGDSRPEPFLLNPFPTSVFPEPKQEEDVWIDEFGDRNVVYLEDEKIYLRYTTDTDEEDLPSRSEWYDGQGLDPDQLIGLLGMRILDLKKRLAAFTVAR